MPPKRLLIVDPAQRSPHSHNFTYNKILCEQAAAAGYEVTLLINQNDGSNFQQVPAKVERVFLHSTYDYVEIHEQWRSPFHRRLNTLRSMISTRLTKLPDITFFTVYPDVAKVITFFCRAIVVILSPFLHLLNFLFDKIVMRSRPYHKDHFANTLTNHFSKVCYSDGDHIVMHSATPAMLESLLELRARLDLRAPLPLHFTAICHHSIMEKHARWWFMDYYQFTNCKWLRRRWDIASPFKSASFLAMSTPLAQELSAATELPFLAFDHVLNKGAFVEAFGPDLAFPPRKTDVFSVGVRASDLTDDNIADVLDMIANVRRHGPPVKFHVLSRGLQSHTSAVLRLLGADPSFQIEDTSTETGFLQALSRMHVVVLPYDPNLYRKRISAVQYECAVVGTAVVAPAETTMTSKEAPGVVYPYSARRGPGFSKGMGGAVVKCLLSRSGDVSAVHFGKRQRDAAARAFRDLVSQLTGLPTGDDKAAVVTVGAYGPVAAIVQPYWGRCGSSTVFDSETEYMLDRGYYLARIMVCQWRMLPIHTNHIFELIRENSLRMKPHLFLVASANRWKALLLLASPTFWRSTAFGQDLMRYATSIDHDPKIADYFFRKSEIAIVNHSFHGSYLKRFQRAKIVLETQDIQALQYQIRNERNRATGRAETVDQWVAEETKVWSDVDACVNLSDAEQSVIARYALRSHTIKPFMDRRELDLKRTWARFIHDNKVHESLADVPEFDFLLWGDLHQANVASTKWFIENVSLHPDFAGTKTFVIGRVGGMMHDQLGSKPGIYYAGFVDQVDDAMQHSKLLVLPDQMGSGISIKALDTLATTRAFVATPLALRSLEFGDVTYRGSATAAELRRDCRKLLDDERAREARADIARKLFDLNYSRAVYYRKWDDVLRDVGLNPEAVPTCSSIIDSAAPTHAERAPKGKSVTKSELRSDVIPVHSN